MPADQTEEELRRFVADRETRRQAGETLTLAIAIAMRAGYTREGTLRSFEERSGRRYDIVLFSLLPDDLS